MSSFPILSLFLHFSLCKLLLVICNNCSLHMLKNGPHYVFLFHSSGRWVVFIMHRKCNLENNQIQNQRLELHELAVSKRANWCCVSDPVFTMYSCDESFQWMLSCWLNWIFRLISTLSLKRNAQWKVVFLLRLSVNRSTSYYIYKIWPCWGHLTLNLGSRGSQWIYGAFHLRLIELINGL